MVNKTKTLDVFGIFETMRVELASKIKISQLVIHHYVTISDQSNWDYNLLPELCSLYARYIQLDAFLEQVLDKMVEVGDIEGRALTKADISFLSTFPKTIKMLESFLTDYNISISYS